MSEVLVSGVLVPGKMVTEIQLSDVQGRKEADPSLNENPDEIKTVICHGGQAEADNPGDIKSHSLFVVVVRI